MSAFLASRAVIKVGGPEARTFLQGLITQEPPTPGTSAFAALLTPQGKVLFDFLVVATDEHFLLDCHGEAADALAKRLSLYRLRANVTIEPLPRLAVSVNWEGSAAGKTIEFDDPRLPALGRRAFVERASAETRNEVAWNARRIQLGVPEFGADFASDEVFLLDVNYDALKGVSYQKGCFVGQEVTSRMKRKGEIRKRTLRLSFEGAPPPKRAPITAGESTLGEVMSGAEGMALALIRVDRLQAAQGAGLPIEVFGRPLRIDVPAYLEQR